MVTFTGPFRATFRVTFLLGCAQQWRGAPLSRPSPRRPTPIATTALRFSIYLDAEGAMGRCRSQIGGGRGVHVEGHAGTCHGKLTPPWR